MTTGRQWAEGLGAAVGITAVLWLVALASSSIPTVASLGTNVHGLMLADYSVSTLRRFAPLTSQVIRDAQGDRPAPIPQPSLQPSPSATPSSTPIPTPGTTLTPTPVPTPMPTLPPLPTATVPPLPTPTIPPLPTPTLPPPPLP